MGLEELRIAVVGHVDHGKSTLVGRLLLDSGAIPGSTPGSTPGSPGNPPTHPGQLPGPEALPGGELPGVTDQLEAERRGRLTLDSGQAVLRTTGRALVLIDTPGHRELVSNTLSGAAWAEAGLLVVDAERGVEPQTRAHLQILSILGIRQLVVALNKMDRVGHQQALFEQRAQQVDALTRSHGLTAFAIVPAGALGGENVVHRGVALHWFTGPSVRQALESLPAPGSFDEITSKGVPAGFDWTSGGGGGGCLPVQLIQPGADDPRVLGRVEGGPLTVGQPLIGWPGGRSHRLVALTHRGAPVDQADPGACVTARLDPPGGLTRGSILASPEAALTPVHETRIRGLSLHGHLPRPGQQVRLRVGASQAAAQVLSIHPPPPPPEVAPSKAPSPEAPFPQVFKTRGNSVMGSAGAPPKRAGGVSGSGGTSGVGPSGVGPSGVGPSGGGGGGLVPFTMRVKLACPLVLDRTGVLPSRRQVLICVKDLPIAIGIPDPPDQDTP